MYCIPQTVYLKDTYFILVAVSLLSSKLLHCKAQTIIFDLYLYSINI